MAGGKSLRMKRSTSGLHKALVPVVGVPMIDRNLFRLLYHGFKTITIAIKASDSGIREHVTEYGSKVASAFEAKVHFQEEFVPLGTIGAAAEAGLLCDSLVVVNVDNLTVIDLQALVDHHIRTSASMTIATHEELFRIPFGEVDVRDGSVQAYLEKPVTKKRISSGTYVLSREACAHLEPGRPADIPHLFHLLKGGNKRIVAFEHRNHWIDVNDESALRNAERLILRHHDEFESLRAQADVHSVTLLIESPNGLLVKRKEAGNGVDTLVLPTAFCMEHQCQWDQLIPEFPFLREVSTSSVPELVTVLDNYDLSERRVHRHHVFRSRVDNPDVLGDFPSDMFWVNIKADKSIGRDRVTQRAISALRIAGEVVSVKGLSP